MGAPLPLPPPPPAASGWEGGLPAPPSAATRPRWRSGGPGWALLHVAIGVAIGVGQLFATSLLLVATSPPLAEGDLGNDQAGSGWAALWLLLCLAAGIVGWLCFVYLNATRGRRWFVFAVIEGIGCAVGTVLIRLALVQVTGQG